MYIYFFVSLEILIKWPRLESIVPSRPNSAGTRGTRGNVRPPGWVTGAISGQRGRAVGCTQAVAGALAQAKAECSRDRVSRGGTVGTKGTAVTVPDSAKVKDTYHYINRSTNVPIIKISIMSIPT